MEPISNWLDDPDWMKSFSVNESDLPPSSKYKQNQRHWDKMQKLEASIRQKERWAEIRRIRNQRSAVAKLLSESKLSDSNKENNLSIDNAENQESQLNNIRVASILAHFSPIAEHQRNTQLEFRQSLNISLSNLLPWRTILMTDINESINQREQHKTMKLTDFKQYVENSKIDKTSKLMHLLQLEKDGAIQLSQSEHLGEIDINISHIQKHQHNSYENKNPNSISSSEGSDIIIKDKQGNTYPEIDWTELSNAQRDKVVADIKAI